ncbi:NAD(P)/FAD-dependent oxidoreductase [Streptomyces sp. NEAU-H22]|uniref:flavin-containing monooxygenase n=1 Tax=unclassified Streptomyces TaxID=2593676 RepID=UPI00225734CA|nr:MULTISPECIES: NAD(P)/FAD-dependent oxidoreductase [unclassified Streptomyces]MCX3290736.1 NAD(P)/FAD-dependent oxidoreductase [Streptomyces sp. NEAU-H22]WMD04640.1 NAD(P)/FAD-dependent oxidoreductase [Streptomyces sp. FXY-T5]
MIGAGPYGLAAAALLNRSGEPTVILERSDRVGASWAQRYDHLRLHTTPSTSKLPGLSVPRQAGRWVSRDDYVRYLEGYVVHHRLDVRVATPVQRVERAEPDSNAQWLVHTPDGPVATDAVVVATGRCHTPNVPDWPGRSTFTGTLLHSAHYRSPAPYRGQHVLVVGAGNSGTEIASVLAGAGAERVRIAVRTPPNILPRSSARWHAAGRLTESLPLAWRDRTSLLTQRLAVPDLTSRGLPRPRTGLYTRNAREGANPVLDHGFVDAVRSGRIEPVPAVQAFDGPDVVLADGTRLRPDTVIAATGYRPGLHDLVGSLGVLDEDGEPLAVGAQNHPAAPRLYFAGFTNPLTGVLRQAGIEARAITQACRREKTRATRFIPQLGAHTVDAPGKGPAPS